MFAPKNTITASSNQCAVNMEIAISPYVKRVCDHIFCQQRVFRTVCNVKKPGVKSLLSLI